MKSLIAIWTCCLGLVSGAFGAATPADLADSPNCVSKITERKANMFNRPAVQPIGESISEHYLH